MQWTNIFKLPVPFAAAIQDDLYYAKRQEQLDAYCRDNGIPEGVRHYSINDLIRPPRMRVLSGRYAQQIIVDVSQEIYRILGTAVHMLMRTHAEKMVRTEGVQHYEAEERMFAHFNLDGQTVVVSGEPDLVTPQGVIDDYKVTAVWGWLKGVKGEWEQQLNGYRWLRDLGGKITTGLSITFILRDWSVNETMQQGYPPAGAQKMDVPMWTMETTKDFFLSRIRLHLRSENMFDEDLPECSAEEMWEKPEAWAVIREGANRATKLHKAEVLGKGVALKAAAADCALRNETLKKGEKPYVVEHRPGERTRCLRYCSARSFCSQFKEYSSAAFRGKAVEER